MAKQKTPRWDLSNWTGGPVTLFQALGLNKKGKATLPTLTPQMSLGEIQAKAAQDSGGNGNPSPGNTGGASSGVPPAPPANASQSAWVSSLMKALGAPDTPANQQSMAAWIRHESSWPPAASYNPLNTTQAMPGATSFNSVGVRNYASPAQGLQATVLTLHGGYPNIVSALRAGNGLCGMGSLSGEFAKWSGGGYSGVC